MVANHSNNLKDMNRLSHANTKVLHPVALRYEKMLTMHDECLLTYSTSWSLCQPPPYMWLTTVGGSNASKFEVGVEAVIGAGVGVMVQP